MKKEIKCKCGVVIGKESSGRYRNAYLGESQYFSNTFYNDMNSNGRQCKNCKAAEIKEIGE